MADNGMHRGPVVSNSGVKHARGSLAVLVLTYNEEKNIEKLIRSVLPLTPHIFVVDSGSTDKTVDICLQFGAKVAHRSWKTYADQFNWGLDNFDFPTQWIMRMDADEEITSELASELSAFLKSPSEDVTGVMVRRRVYFMGRWIKHGGYYPTWLLRVFRNGLGRCEALWMDEHIVISRGITHSIAQDIIDKNNKDLTFWTEKHNRYASREVLDILEKERTGFEGDVVGGRYSGNQIEKKRWMKKNVYGRAPILVRPLLFFLYRYVLKMGFRDGIEGLIFHFLQGFWYRFLVDAKLYEARREQRLTTDISMTR